MNDLFILVILSYVILAFYFNFGFNYNKKDRQLISDNREHFEHLLISVPIILHGGILYHFVFNAQLNLNISVGYLASAVIWASVMIYWLIGLFTDKLILLRSWVLTGGAFASILVFVFPPVKHLNYTDLPIFTIHIIVALLAYGLLILATLQSFFILLYQKHLKSLDKFDEASNFWFLMQIKRSVSLLSLEKNLFKLARLGFIFLTFTLITGTIFSQEIFHQSFQFNHKNILSLIAWILLAVLILGRKFGGWRGSKTNYWLISSVSLLSLGYLGSKLVLEIILQRY